MASGTAGEPPEELRGDAQRDSCAQSENLTHLQAESLKLMALIPGLIGYVWLDVLMWLFERLRPSPAAWVGGSLLLLSAVLSYAMRGRHLRLASGLLVIGSLLGVGCALLDLRSPGLAYLFVLPIIFASVLLTQVAVFVAAGLAALLTLIVSHGLLGRAVYSADVGTPILVIALTAAAAWLAARNLYTALAWVWSGYERAHRNEQLARRQQAELRRALKALDEATYRLERANYMLTLARDQAEEAQRLKQQFAQTISHELRTPLNLVVSFTELMAQAPEYYGGPLPPAYARDLGIVHRNARHLQTLINDVLDLARIEAAQMSILPEETDPATLAQETISAARSLVEAKGLALHVEIEPSLPRLFLDPARIRQALFNLLSNAARFTERGSITVSVRRQGEEVLFAVADTGIGIAPQDIPRIFEEFQQLDGSTRRRHGGAGLGLAISRRFVELHGGRIWVDSDPGQGSTFTFTLPTAHHDPLIEAKAGPSKATAGRSVRQGEEPILLAITRSPAAASLLTRYLHGCRTVIAQDLEHARRAAGQLLPQAVVVDTANQGLDANLLQELAQTWGLPRASFLACPLPGEEPLRQQLAVDGYLVKPVSRQSLWDVLRQLGQDVDKVLVVDDDRDFVRLMGRLLDSPIRRYQVINAYSGREALEMIQYHRPDLVLLDLMLPDTSGLQVIDRIRSDPAWHYLPIVVVSGQDEGDTGGAMPGVMLATKASGLQPGDVVQWVQNAVDTSSRHFSAVGSQHAAAE